jgi:hypothetical protein
LQLSGWLQKIRAGEWQFCIGRQSLFHQNHWQVSLIDAFEMKVFQLGLQDIVIHWFSWNYFPRWLSWYVLLKRRALLVNCKQQMLANSWRRENIFPTLHLLWSAKVVYVIEKLTTRWHWKSSSKSRHCCLFGVAFFDRIRKVRNFLA